MQEGVPSDSRYARRKLFERKDPITGQKPATSVEDSAVANLKERLRGFSPRIAPVLSAVSLSAPAFGFDGSDKLRR